MKKLAIILSAFATSFALAQSSNGKVLDEMNARPIAGAEVKIGNQKYITDESGNFKFDCAVNQVLTANYTDYKTTTFSIQKCDGNLLITLTPIGVRYFNEVEVTASSGKKDMLHQPASIAKIGLDEIKRGNGLFMDDAINSNIPGVHMQRRTVGAGQTFNIRGYGNGVRGTNGVNSNFDTQGAKVYLNGIAITDAEGITLMDDIDFGMIGDVEVLKGPSGSLYGLAIAGAVNLSSIRPQAGHTSVSQEVMLGSYGLERYNTRVQIGSAKSSLIANYGKQKYDGFMKHTASNKDFVNLIGSYDANEKQKFTTYFGYSNSYDERNGELTKGQYDTLDYSGNPAYIKNNAHSNVISYRAGISHSYKLSESLSNTTSVFGAGMSSNVSSAGGWTDKSSLNFGLRSTLDYKRKLGDKFQIAGVTGIEVQRQDANVVGYNMVKDSFAVSPDADNIIGNMRSNVYTISKTYNYFTEWTLSLPADISLTAGIGVANMSIELNDRFYVASNNNPSNPAGTNKPWQYQNSYNNLISPKVALNKVFSKALSVYASYSKGYKAPVSSYFYIPVTGQINTNLKPEVGNQFEIGTKGSLLKNKLVYTLALFNTVFNNKMTVFAQPNAANTATSYTYVMNGGTQTHRGVEAMLKYTILQSQEGFVKNLTPFVNAAISNFTYGDFRIQRLNATKDSVIETNYSGNKVTGVPPLTFNAGVDFASNVGLYANMVYSYRGKVFYTIDNLEQASGFGLLNAKLGYNKTFFNHLNIDAYFGINNMLSTQHYVMLFNNQLPDAYLPGPKDINFFGGLTLKYLFK
ncbi:MAG: hypothetical protein RL264_403 [Bacteroidota bacterium]|jgi:iron complex outermembrane receptor protein